MNAGGCPGFNRSPTASTASQPGTRLQAENQTQEWPIGNICAVYPCMSKTSQGLLINQNESHHFSITLTDINLCTCLMMTLSPICASAVFMEDLIACFDKTPFGLQFCSCTINRFWKPSTQGKYIYEYMNEMSKNSTNSGKVIAAIPVSQAFIVSVLFFLYF